MAVGETVIEYVGEIISMAEALSPKYHVVVANPPYMGGRKLNPSLALFVEEGFANYKAIVGPTIVYGRRVEMGGGNWKKGVRFPYMEPAWEKFRTQVHSQIVRKYFGKGSR